MTPTKPVLASAIWDGRKLVMTSPEQYRADLKRLELGAGEAVTIRVERPEDARKYHQLKHLFGHLYEPVERYSGHSKLELHAMAKAMYLPDGKLSTVDLSYDEMDAFCQHVERWLRESMPEAFSEVAA